MKKIAAFTLLELMIALLISTVIVGMVYYGLMLFNQQYFRYQARSGQRNEYMLLRKVLENDIEHGLLFIDNTDKPAIVIELGPEQVIQFYPGPNTIVRLAGHQIDTFHCGVLIGQVFNVDDSLKLVQSFNLTVTVNGEKIPASFSKKYTAAELMKPATHE